MAKIAEMEKVQDLRQRGFSLQKIANLTKNSKSTISYWCKNIFLSHRQLKKLQNKRKTAGSKALFDYSERKRNERFLQTEIASKKGKDDVDKINRRDLFIIGLALYWGEGYKKGNDELGFTNSDPFIIKFIMKWFREIYFINDKDFILRVSINSAHRKRVTDIISFWSKIARINKSQFTKSSFIFTSSKKTYKNNKKYFGTLRIKVRRGTELRRRIIGSLKALENYATQNQI